MNRVFADAHKIYIDANIVIYLIEGHADFQDQAENILAYAIENDILLMTSEVAVAECLYGAHRLDRNGVVEKYELFFRDTDLIHLVPIDLGTCKAAAKIGAENRLKLIDAIHIASAVAVDCDIFITNDKGIRPIAGIRVVQLSTL